MKLALVAGALSTVAVAAMAQNAAPATPNAEAPKVEKAKPDGKRGGRLSRLDANNDGVVDAQEYAALGNLKEADANGDGVLSNDELLAMIEKREAERKVERLTRQLDVDGDGKVTIAEIEAHKAKRFALMDRNNDGKLEGRELRGDRHGGERIGKNSKRGDREHRHGYRSSGEQGGRDGGKHWKHHDDGPMPDRT